MNRFGPDFCERDLTALLSYGPPLGEWSALKYRKG